MTVNVSHLQQAMKNLLNPREQIEFIELTNDFHARRNLQDFAYSLKVRPVCVCCVCVGRCVCVLCVCVGVCVCVCVCMYPKLTRTMKCYEYHIYTLNK